MRAKSRTSLWFLSLFFLALPFFVLQAPGKCHAFEAMIDVSPDVLNLQMQGQVVTIHSDVAFDAVDVSTVYMNGVPVATWKEEEQGYFVARFLIRDIRNLPLFINELNEFKLVGLTFQNDAFWAVQYVKVINVLPGGGRLEY